MPTAAFGDADDAISGTWLFHVSACNEFASVCRQQVRNGTANHAEHLAWPIGRNQNGAPYTRCARSGCEEAGLAMGQHRSAAPQSKNLSADVGRRCTQNTRMGTGRGSACDPMPAAPVRRHRCMIDSLGAARKHQRVLRASPYCICAGFFSVLPRHSHATQPFPAGCRKFVARRSDFEG
jgi:hypothetical protein